MGSGPPRPSGVIPFLWKFTLKTLSRFNYWEFPDINPLLPAVPRSAPPVLSLTYLGDYYRSRFTAGDETAILEFAARDKTALRRRWVVAALEVWQRQGTPEARSRVQAFCEEFLKPASSEEAVSLLKIITDDQQVFRDVVNLHHSLQFPLPEAGQLAAQRLGWPAGMAAEVYRHYQTALALFFRDNSQGAYPWGEIFTWLQTCLGKLKQL